MGQNPTHSLHPIRQQFTRCTAHLGCQKRLCRVPLQRCTTHLPGVRSSGTSAEDRAKRCSSSSSLQRQLAKTVPRCMRLGGMLALGSAPHTSSVACTATGTSATCSLQHSCTTHNPGPPLRPSAPEQRQAAQQAAVGLPRHLLAQRVRQLSEALRGVGLRRRVPHPHICKMVLVRKHTVDGTGKEKQP